MEDISIGTGATDVAAPTRRLNSFPTAATKMYLQVSAVTGFLPVSVFMYVYGVEGPVACVDTSDIEVDLDVGDISVSAPFAQATHTTPNSFTAAVTGPTTVLCAGAPFIIDEVNCRVVFLVYRHAGGDWAAPLVNAIGGVSLTAAANVITLAGSAGAPLIALDELWIGVAQRPVSGGGGGAAGGGDAIYTSPQDFSVAFAALTQVTLTGLSYTPTVEQFVSVQSVDVTGMAKTYTPDANAFTWVPATGVLTVNNGTFAATDSYRVMVFGPDKSFSAATNSKRVQEIDPLSTQSVWENILANAALAIGTYWYPSANGMNMSGFKNLLLGLQVGPTGIVTVEGSVDPTGVDFFDISRSGVDLQSNAAGVANWSGTNAILDFEELGVPLVRVKVVVAAGPAAVQLDVRRTAL
jgi:hypothetical protein